MKSILILFASATIASAHPGPPGHTHEGGNDDWPFDPIIPMVVIAAAFLGFGAHKLQTAKVKR